MRCSAMLWKTEDGNEMIAIAAEYIGGGIGIYKVSSMLHIPRCTLYRQPYRPLLPRGRKTSSITLRAGPGESTSSATLKLCLR